MSMPLNSQEVLDREYLEIRGKIVELAASLDRLDRAEGCVSDDNRMSLIKQGLEMLLQEADQSKAKQIQMLFSRVYQDNWREHFDI